MNLHNMITEEESSLEQAQQKIQITPQPEGPNEEDLVQQILMLRDEINTAKTEDLPALTDQLTREMAILDSLRNTPKRQRTDPKNPYFGHIRLVEDDFVQDVYIGQSNFLSDDLVVVDWRDAPISRIYYLYDEGDDYDENIGGKFREGELEIRRTLFIRNGELLRVSNGESTFVKIDKTWGSVEQQTMKLAGGEGTSLRRGSPITSQLGGGKNLRATKFLPDIAALIDPEQFDLITANQSGVMIIRGSAGSGKTTVTLHRIAYLIFNNPQRFQTRSMMFVVWGRAMKDYVAHVLPSLGVTGVTVETWTRWSQKMIQRHFPRLPRERNDYTPPLIQRWKLSAQLRINLKQELLNLGYVDRMQILQTWMECITDLDAIKKSFSDLTPIEYDEIKQYLQKQNYEFSLWIDEHEDQELLLDYEDDALILRAYQIAIGPLSQKGQRVCYSHLAIDEVQDFSPIEIEVLLDCCDRHRCVTLAGDTRQHISKEAGFSSWSSFLEDIGVENNALHTLEISYRSTHPIVRFAQQLLENDEEPPPKTLKEGPEVELFLFSDHGACVGYLSDKLNELMNKEPLANVAVIVPNDTIGKLYYDGFVRTELPHLRLIEDQKFSFLPGVDIVNVNDIKGLEFDYVIIVETSDIYYPTTPHCRRLLHVAATRAVHQLWLTCCGTPSRILPSTYNSESY